MHRLSLCLLVSLLSACIVHAAPPTVGQYEIRKRTSTGFESYGVTLTNGQAIGQSGGIPAAVTVGTGTVTSVALTLPGIFSVTGSPITESGTLAASLATQTANRVWAGPTTGSAAAPTFRALVANDLPDLSSVYQPIAGILTAFSGLSNTTGVLTNNGSGSLSYTATSTGGNKDADSGKLVKFDSVGGVYFSNEVRIYPYPSGSNFLQFNNSRIQWLRGVSDYCNIIPSEAGSACTFYFPTNPGTHTLALEDGNITGTAGGLSSTLAVTSGGTGQTSYTDGQLLIGNTTGNTLAKATLTAGSGISITNGHGTITIASTSSGGTVTSVALTLPGIFSVTGSPITESGTLAASLATQTANRVWAGPTTGTAAAPTFRALVAADIPDLSGTYQPRASTVTAFGELANAAGVLTNNGSGTLSYTATSTGGNGTDDSGKIVKFNYLGAISGAFVGTFDGGPSYNFVSISEGLGLGNETNSGTFGPPAGGGTLLVWTLPSVTGTLVSTGDTGSVTNTMLAGSIALTKLLQTSATSGQVIAWNGAAWAPTTISSGLTIGSTAISGGTSGRLLLSGTTLAELTLGSGVQTALGNTANASGGLLTYGAIGTIVQAYTTPSAASQANAGTAYMLQWTNSSASTSGSGYAGNVALMTGGVDSGSTAGSWARLDMPSNYTPFWAAVTTPPYASARWTKPFVMSFAIQAASTTTNGKTWLKFAQKASTVGDLTSRGVGVRITGSSLVGVWHNGTTGGATAQILALTTTYQPHQIAIVSDGAGNITWVVDGVAAATVSTGPSTNETDAYTGAGGWTLESYNNADSARQSVSSGAVSVQWDN